MKKILVIGGGGYVGSRLVPDLLKLNYKVDVYDLFIYGKKVFSENDKLNLIQGDVRDLEHINTVINNHEIVIHLACISNDPSFELNPKLGKSINLDCFRPLVEISKKKNVKRFIYASSSSVYGIKSEKNVSEDLSLEPLTDYSKFKVECEKILFEYKDDNFETVIVRPATVCGYAKRQRLDVVVNILTNLAFNKRRIKVLGGSQLRPNIHIKDMSRIYIKLIESKKELVNGQIFNAGYDNMTVNEIANTVKKVVGQDVEIEKEISNDNRSYHISSEKIKKILKFEPNFTIEDAVIDLKEAFEKNKLPNSLTDSIYFNIKKMQEINLK